MVSLSKATSLFVRTAKTLAAACTSRLTAWRECPMMYSGLIWHIWWLAVLGLFGVFAPLLVFAFRDEEEIEISAEQIARFERRARTEVA